MTGFSRESGESSGYSWSWEVRSVNAKALDARLRLPSGFEKFETEFRKRIGEKFSRGNISAHLSLSHPDRQLRYVLNEDALAQLSEISGTISARLGAAPVTADALMGLRGVVEQTEDEEDEDVRTALEAKISDSFDAALAALAENRREEGRRLYDVMSENVSEVDRLVTSAASLAETQPGKIRGRLRARIDEILGQDPPLSEDRLAQEVAILLVKGDIREEIDRLKSHISGARTLLEKDEAIGRQLDFLCQEFNREANTICSKAADIEMTQIGLDLKTVIDRIREQVQNIE